MEKPEDNVQYRERSWAEFNDWKTALNNQAVIKYLNAFFDSYTKIKQLQTLGKYEVAFTLCLKVISVFEKMVELYRVDLVRSDMVKRRAKWLMEKLKIYKHCLSEVLIHKQRMCSYARHGFFRGPCHSSRSLENLFKGHYYQCCTSNEFGSFTDSEYKEGRFYGCRFQRHAWDRNEWGNYPYKYYTEDYTQQMNAGAGNFHEFFGGYETGTPSNYGDAYHYSGVGDFNAFGEKENQSNYNWGEGYMLNQYTGEPNNEETDPNESYGKECQDEVKWNFGDEGYYGEENVLLEHNRAVCAEGYESHELIPDCQEFNEGCTGEGALSFDCYDCEGYKDDIQSAYLHLKTGEDENGNEVYKVEAEECVIEEEHEQNIRPSKAESLDYILPETGHSIEQWYESIRELSVFNKKENKCKTESKTVNDSNISDAHREMR